MASSSKTERALERAIRLLNRGETPKAKASCHAVLAAEPGNADALHLLGLTWRQEGSLQEAVSWMEKAVAASPGFWGAWYNLGDTLVALGRLDEAERCYLRAIDINPSSADAQVNLGNLHLRRGERQEAQRCYERALVVAPAHAGALNNLGLMRRADEDTEGARALFERALRSAPRNVEAWLNLGNLAMSERQFSQAVEYFTQALAIAPRAAEVATGLGNARLSLGQPEAAVDAYRDAVRFAPGAAVAHSNLLLALNYCSGLSVEEVFEAHRRWGDEVMARVPAVGPAAPRSGGRHIRVGYVSADLRRHPVAFLLEPVLQRHDRSRFDVYCYAGNKDTDEFTKRLHALSHWRDASGLSDEALAQMIRQDGIDILVDLSGHTGGNRLPVFARRPAPIQLSWLGYFNTTGLPAMDYVLSDGYLTPPDCQQPFVEKLVRLPHSRFCYRPPEYAPPVAPFPCAETGCFTFGSFNRLEKVNDQVIRLWARCLDAVPGSRLLLKAKVLGDPWGREYWQKRFADLGLGPDRLALSGYLDHPQMLDEYRQVDVALDTFPFTGGLTTLEALWMGVPVVTLAGSTMVGRQSLAILDLLGLESLVAQSDEQYIGIVQDLAADPARLAALRTDLRPRMLGSPLCDAEAFTRVLEGVYTGLVK